MSANPRLHTLSLQSYYIAEDNSTQVTQETTYTYDATGNIVADGTHAYTYDSRNRLIGVDDNITYQYNYDNKRVSKTVNGTTTYFIYDAHRLIGEYDSEGNVNKEYLYNGNTPMAIITVDGIYKIYADHLDTPRRVADSTNTIVWSWESKPFGEDEANGTIEMNLRFPGQYFDAETKTHCNINRDYNPVTGRYVQSDPVGLDGGVNMFLYVGGNPLIYTDLLGLARCIILVGDPGLGDYNTGTNFSRAAKTRESALKLSGHTVRIYRVSNITQFNSAITTGIKIDGGIIYYGHGSSHALYVGEQSDPGTNIDSGNIGSLSNINIAKDATIELNSCSSAVGPNPSIAAMFSIQLKRTTTGWNRPLGFTGTPGKYLHGGSAKPPATGDIYVVPTPGGHQVTF